MGWLVLNKVKDILNNGCKYKGPKEGKSVMNNSQAADLDYNLPATSTIATLGNNN